MSGVNSTSNWDVLVSYSVTKLNALLPSLWKRDTTFTNVSMEFDYETFGIRMAATFDIGAPTLQFLTGESSRAQSGRIPSSQMITAIRCPSPSADLKTLLPFRLACTSL
jgi:hypothetical protein